MFYQFYDYAGSDNKVVSKSPMKQLEVTGSSNYHIQEGKPHLICQYLIGHPFIINIVCRGGTVMFSDIYDVGSNSTKRLLTDHLKQRFKNWIRQFCEAKKFEGLLSFDFIIENISEEIYCVGCRPNLDLSIIKRHQPEEVITTILSIVKYQLFLPKCIHHKYFLSSMC